jgi:hypothetical protein
MTGERVCAICVRAVTDFALMSESRNASLYSRSGEVNPHFSLEGRHSCDRL